MVVPEEPGECQGREAAKQQFCDRVPGLGRVRIRRGRCAQNDVHPHPRQVAAESHRHDPHLPGRLGSALPPAQRPEPRGRPKTATEPESGDDWERGIRALEPDHRGGRTGDGHMNPPTGSQAAPVAGVVTGGFPQQQHAQRQQHQPAGGKTWMLAPVDRQHAQPDAGGGRVGKRAQPPPDSLLFEPDQNPGANTEHHEQESVEEEEAVEIGLEVVLHASREDASRRRRMDLDPPACQMYLSVRRPPGWRGFLLQRNCPAGDGLEGRNHSACRALQRFLRVPRPVDWRFRKPRG